MASYSLYLLFEKTGSDEGLGIDAAACQQVNVGKLVIAVLEVRRFDPSLIDERLHAVVDLAETETKGLGELALAGQRMLLQEFEESVLNLVRHGME